MTYQGRLSNSRGEIVSTRRIWPDLIASRMSGQCCIRPRSLLYNSTFLFLQFPEFLKPQEICLFNDMFKDCFQLPSILFCWKKTLLEIQNHVENDRFDLPGMDNSECKGNKPQRCTCERHLKDERKTNITSNLNLAVLHDSSLSLSAAHFFIIIIYNLKKKITFPEQWNWMVDCPVDSRKLQKYFKQYI